MIKIHQFTPSIVEGDGVSNGVIYTQKILESLGFISNIYAGDIGKSLRDRVLSYKKIDKGDSSQILLIHYSIYYDFSSWIDKLKCKKLMVYHNITPYHFFKKGTLTYKLCKEGVEYLPELSTKVDGAIGVSPLNSQELEQHGFKNVATIPLLVDTNKILDATWDYKLFDKISEEEFTIIFVGRIARNKAQHDLIKIAFFYRQLNPNFKLYIIGGTTDSEYREELEDLIYSYSLETNLILTGKVSNEELYAYYRGADIFLCMSEHEGFGIPLIESMLFKLPVIAYNSSNIKNTLNGGGVLFNEKSHKHIAGVMELIRTNRAFRRAILETQRGAIEIYRHKSVVSSLVKYLNSMGIEAKVPKIEESKGGVKFQFEGPFDSSYSLAIVNRYSALIFDKKYPNQVSLYPTEGGGDYTPNIEFLKENPEVSKMYALAEKGVDSQVTFRNLYPPRVTGMRGDLNLLNSYGWEESGFPLEYVKKFNQNLDGITVMSNYVKQVLGEAGVKVPMEVVGLGADHILNLKPKPMELKTQKKFKFLHISSCFPRKGVDILLKAYTETFTKDDDVTLIIKTFPNPHNSVAEEIERIEENPNAPEIILINRDLPDENVVWLYQNCNVLVAPSRGEGFGLPMAEAMLFKLPVITTGFGGQSGFCTEDTAWLIDYSFQRAKTHLDRFNSYWAEPKLKKLKEMLKAQLNISSAEKSKKIEKAYNLISREFGWVDYREKTEKFISSLKTKEVFEPKRVNLGWVSSYNSKCGIASYSEFILENLSKRYSITIFANYIKEPLNLDREKNVVRCWKNRFDKDSESLIQNIVDRNIGVLIINFNFGFFSTNNLKDIINVCKKEKIKIIIIFHSVADVTIKGQEASLKNIAQSLTKVDTLLVHTIGDLNFFKAMGLSNMRFLPHGVTSRNIKVKGGEVQTIASYGFMLPHKGILELIEAFAILAKQFPKLKLLLVNSIYPVPESEEYFKRCQRRVEELELSKKVRFETQFLDNSETFKLLDSVDLIVLPYRRTQESSSGAVRHAIATKKPILCTPQAIFDDVADIVHFTQGFTPQDIANKIFELVVNSNTLFMYSEKQSRWIEEHDWGVISRRLEYFIN